jgi:hypothetical protein
MMENENFWPEFDRRGTAAERDTLAILGTIASRTTTDLGHEEQFPPPRLSDHYGFSKETVARVPGTDRDAPKPAIPRVQMKSRSI